MNDVWGKTSTRMMTATIVLCSGETWVEFKHLHYVLYMARAVIVVVCCMEKM